MAEQSSTSAVLRGAALAIGTTSVSAALPAKIVVNQPIADGPNFQLGLENDNAAGTAGLALAAEGGNQGGMLLTGSAPMGLPANTLVIGNLGDASAGMVLVTNSMGGPSVSISAAGTIDMLGGGNFFTGADGGFATPSIAWTGDHTTGFWRSGVSVYVASGAQTAFQFNQGVNVTYSNFVPNGNEVFALGGSGNTWSNFFLASTITTPGTTGAQTINKPTGSVNLAASATSLVVTNSLVSTNSVIMATVATNDTTCKSVQVVAGSGSFTIYPNVAPTAETRVNFFIVNH